MKFNLNSLLGLESKALNSIVNQYPKNQFLTYILNGFINSEKSANIIADTFTNIGLEVEELIDKKEELKNFIVAEVIETKKHESADKLKVCSVYDGKDNLQIVCGAPNARAGIKVVLAKVGTIIPEGNFKIKKSSIRGVESEGMLCSEKELGLGKDHDGIMELPEYCIPGEKFYNKAPFIDLNITPNRGDCLGLYGIARDLIATKIATWKNFDNTANNLLKMEFPDQIEKFNIKKDINIDNNDICPVFWSFEVENITNTESPKWLQEELEGFGMNSKNSLVDIGNYIMCRYGTPIHIYDRDKINGNITIRTPNVDEKQFTALNDIEYELNENDIVVADEQEILCIAGIIGGKNSCCSLDTKNILIEIAEFDKSRIIKTGQRLNLQTDSRHRFERGIDREAICGELNRSALYEIMGMILQLCGGISSIPMHTGNPKSPEREIEFRFSKFKHKIGMDIEKEKACEILQSLDFKILYKDDILIKLQIPSWRHDITIEEDIVEEILRINGYDNIPNIPLTASVYAKDDNQFTIEDIARNSLIDNGLHDCITWSFINITKAKLFGEVVQDLELHNPISSEFNMMRNSIYPNLLDGCKDNIARNIKDVNIFEIGRVYKDNSIEELIASGLRTGSNIEQNVHVQSRKTNVFDIKQDIEYLLQSFNLDITKLTIDKNNIPDYYNPHCAGIMKLGNKVISYFGQLHPRIVSEFNIKQDIYGFEIYLENIPFSHKTEKWNKKSDYQSVVRDFAFVIEKSHNLGPVISLIRKVDRNLIRKVSLVDLYEMEKETNKKSFSLRVTLQSFNETLTDDVINSISNNIINKVIEETGAILRDF